MSGFGALAVAVVLLAGTHSFKVANIVADSRTVSAIHYTLNGTTPTNISAVMFTLEAAPIAGSTMKAQIGGTWYACTNVATRITCDTTVGAQLTVAKAASLEAIVGD